MSGSTIGGIVGGAIGFVVTGFNPVGAQVGFTIGSAIGAYVDPVQVKGPRLNDAMTQTSNVGGVIPFGYGRYVTAGNIIWCDKLIEHVKRQRQGKGASSKTTTYTYTRSYAIGVCQGEIYGFLWIKRNGKKVYTSDPAATSEERAYSAKWTAKATLHLGTEAQMPDSTIVAVEGAGNVSPFRGLAYIVVENDDLTDLSGAIPQYEFCVIASAPDVYVTSHPFPVDADDDVRVTYAATEIFSRQIMKETYQLETIKAGYSATNIFLKDSYNATYLAESMATSYSAVRIENMKVLTLYDNYKGDLADLSYSAVGIALNAYLITLTPSADGITAAYSAIGIKTT